MSGFPAGMPAPAKAKVSTVTLFDDPPVPIRLAEGAQAETAA
jgi:hypothetical protein